MLYSNLIIPIQVQADLIKADCKSLFLEHSFIYANISNLSVLEISKSVHQQLLQLPLIQSDLKWRYKSLSKLITSPSLLISLEKDVCNCSNIVFNFNQNFLKIYVAANVILTEKIKDFINIFVMHLRHYCA